jgi:hypothetical protein
MEFAPLDTPTALAPVMRRQTANPFALAARSDAR